MIRHLKRPAGHRGPDRFPRVMPCSPVPRWLELHVLSGGDFRKVASLPTNSLRQSEQTMVDLNAWSGLKLWFFDVDPFKGDSPSGPVHMPHEAVAAPTAINGAARTDSLREPVLDLPELHAQCHIATEALGRALRKGYFLKGSEKRPS